jgi:hypothetical protein
LEEAAAKRRFFAQEMKWFGSGSVFTVEFVSRSVPCFFGVQALFDVGSDVKCGADHECGEAKVQLGVDPSDLGVEPSDLGVEPSDLGVEPSDLGVDGDDIGVEDLAAH